MTQSGMIKGKQINIESINLIPNESPLALTSFTVSTASTTFSGKQIINLEYLNDQLDLKIDITQINDNATSSTSSLWSADKIYTEITGLSQSIDSVSISISNILNDFITGSTTGWSSEKIDEELITLENSVNIKIDSVSISVANLLNDSITGSTTGWSSEKINNELDLKLDDSQLNDAAATSSTTSLWSVNKIYTELQAIEANDLQINDNATSSTTSLWSANKIYTEIQGLSSSVDARIDIINISVSNIEGDIIGLSNSIDSLSVSVADNTANIDSVSISVANILNDGITGSTTGWSSEKINNELDLKLDDSQLNDSIIGTLSLWSSDKISSEIQGLSSSVNTRIDTVSASVIGLSQSVDSLSQSVATNTTNIDSVSISVANLLNDSITGSITGWSSEKIDEELITLENNINSQLDLKLDDSQLNDTIVGTDSLWSSDKIDSEIQGLSSSVNTRIDTVSASVIGLSQSVDSISISVTNNTSTITGLSQSIDVINVTISNIEGDITGLSQSIDSVSISVANLLNDSITGSTTGWSSEKIDEELITLENNINSQLDLKLDVSQLNDAAATSSTTSLWSVNKIYTELQAIEANDLQINDAVTATDSVWSSNKIDNELDLKVDKTQIDDGGTGTTSLWSVDRLLTEFELKLDVSQLNDSIISATGLWSSDKISSEIQGLSSSVNTRIDTVSASVIGLSQSVDSLSQSVATNTTNIDSVSISVANILNDSVTGSTTGWSSNKIDSELDFKLDDTQLNDVVIGTNSLWSSDKINSEVQGLSSSVYAEIDSVSISVANLLNDSITGSTTGWTSQKIDSELDLKLDVSQLNDAAATSSTTSLWSVNKIYNELQAIDADHLQINDNATSSTTSVWSGNKVYTEIQGLSSSVYAEIDSVSISVSNLLNDNITGSTTGWSSEKIDEELITLENNINIKIDSVSISVANLLNDSITGSTTGWSSEKINSELDLKLDDSQLNDVAATSSTTSLWSVNKIYTELQAIDADHLQINDNVTSSTTSVWSGNKVYTEIQGLSSSVNTRIDTVSASVIGLSQSVDSLSVSVFNNTTTITGLSQSIDSVSISVANLLNDSITGSTTGWSSQKINDELDLKLDDSQLNDSAATSSTTSLWSVNKIYNELELKLDDSQINDAATSSTTSLWSSDKLYTEFENKLDTSLTNSYIFLGSPQNVATPTETEKIYISSVSDVPLTEEYLFLNGNTVTLAQKIESNFQIAERTQQGWMVSKRNVNEEVIFDIDVSSASLFNTASNELDISNYTGVDSLNIIDSTTSSPISITISSISGLESGYNINLRLEGQGSITFENTSATAASVGDLILFNDENRTIVGGTYSQGINIKNKNGVNLEIDPQFDIIIDQVNSNINDSTTSSTTSVWSANKIYTELRAIDADHLQINDNATSSTTSVWSGNKVYTEIQGLSQSIDSVSISVANILNDSITGSTTGWSSQKINNELDLKLDDTQLNDSIIGTDSLWSSDKINSEVQGLSSSVNSRIDTVSASVIDNTNTIIGLSSSVDSLSLSVFNNTTDITGLSNSIDIINVTISNIEGDIIGLSNSIDSVSISVSNLLNDSITGSTTGWTSQKINNELDLKLDDSQLNDAAATSSTTSLWSVNKIYTELQAIDANDLQINDNITATDSVWSSNKIDSEIQGLSSSVNTRIDTVSASVIGLSQSVDSLSVSVFNNTTDITGLSQSIDSVSISVANILNDGITGSTTGWSSNKIDSELDLKLDVSQLNDSIIGTLSLWSSDKTNTEIQGLSSSVNTRIDTVSASVIGLSQSVDSLSQSVATNTTNIDSVSISVANILNDSITGSTTGWSSEKIDNELDLKLDDSQLNDAAATSSTTSLWSVNKIYTELQTIDADHLQINDNATSSTTSVWSGNKVYTEIQGLSSSVYAEIDSVSISVSNLLNDSIIGSTTGWTSQKISDELDLKLDDTQINDTATSSTTSLWSSDKLYTEFQGKLGTGLTESYIFLGSVGNIATETPTEKIYPINDNDVLLTESYLAQFRSDLSIGQKVETVNQIAEKTPNGWSIIKKNINEDLIYDIDISNSSNYTISSNELNISDYLGVDTLNIIDGSTSSPFSITVSTIAGLYADFKIRFTVDTGGEVTFEHTDLATASFDDIVLSSGVNKTITGSTYSDYLSIQKIDIINKETDLSSDSITSNITNNISNSINDGTTSSTTSLWSANKIYTELQAIDADHLQIIDSVTSSTTSVWSGNKVYTEIQGLSSSIFAEIDSVSISVSNLLNDSITGSTTGWTSQKISNELDLKLDDTQINDTATSSTTSLWSSNKLYTEFENKLDTGLTESYIFLGNTANESSRVPTSKLYIDNVSTDILTETYVSNNYSTASIGQKVEASDQIAEKTQTDWMISKKNHNQDIVKDLDISSASLFATSSNQMNITQFIGVDTINIIDSSTSSFSATISTIFGLFDRSSVKFKVTTGGSVTFEHTDIASASFYDISLLSGGNVTIIGSTYSEFLRLQKINNINIEEDNVSLGVGSVTINDSSTSSTTETWSADKIYTEITGISASLSSEINDSITATDSTWSSDKIQTEIDDSSLYTSNGTISSPRTIYGNETQLILDGGQFEIWEGIDTTEYGVILRESGGGIRGQFVYDALSNTTKLELLNGTSSFFLANGGTVSVKGAFTIDDDDNSHYLQFSAGSLTQSLTYVFPSDYGTDGQALITDGSGTLDWITVATNSLSINDSSTNSTTEVWSADKTYTEIQGLSSSVFGEIDSVSISVSNLLNDSITGSTTGWTSQKINNELDLKLDDTQLNDAAATSSTTSLWSVNKIYTELELKLDDSQLNDAVTATDSVWSSNKIDNELDLKVDKTQIDDGGTGTTSLWSVDRLLTEFELKLDVSQLNDSIISATGLWSSDKIDNELDLKLDDTQLNDAAATSSTTSLWSVNKIYTELDLKLDDSQLNDTITTTNSLWSSDKIDTELDLKLDDTQINDSATNVNILWSSDKIDTELDLKLDDTQLDDGVTGTDSFWSSVKITTELDTKLDDNQLNDSATNSTTSLWSADKIYTELDLKLDDSQLNDGATSSTTSMWSANKIQFELDSLSFSSVVINDSVTATDSVWSSDKIDTELDTKLDDTQINDSATNVNILWSSDKIDTELDLKLDDTQLNDGVTGTDSFWSSVKITSELDSKLDDSQLNDSATNSLTSMWSADKIYTELQAIEANDLQIIDSVTSSTTSVWSGNKVYTELELKLDDSQLNDSITTSTNLWSADKIQTEINDSSFYLNNGTLSTNRTIDANESTLTLERGQFEITSGADTVDYGLIVRRDVGLTAYAKLVFDELNDTAILDVASPTGSFFSASNGIVSVNGEFRILDDDQSNYLRFSAGSLTQSLIYAFPPNYGTNGEVLITNGLGDLSWTASSGGGISSLTENTILIGNTVNEPQERVVEKIYVDNLSTEFLSTEYLYTNHYTTSISQKIESKYQVAERTQQDWMISKKNHNQDIIFDIDISNTNIYSTSSQALDIENYLGADVLNIIDSSTTSSIGVTISSIIGVLNDYRFALRLDGEGTINFDDVAAASASVNSIVLIGTQSQILTGGTYSADIKFRRVNGVNVQIDPQVSVVSVGTSGGGGSNINDAVTATESTWSSTKISSEITSGNTNIYTADGTLTSDRTISGGANAIILANGDFNIQPSGVTNIGFGIKNVSANTLAEFIFDSSNGGAKLDLKNSSLDSYFSADNGVVSVAAAAEFRIFDDNNSHYLRLSAGSLTANRTYVFPSDYGTAGGIMTSDGAGNLSWSVVGAGIDSSGGTVSLESDQRGNIFQIGRDTNDYILVNTTVIDFRLDGNLDMRLENDGDLHVDGDVFAFSTTTSDESLKDNIETIESASEKISKLRGVEFIWNGTSRKGQKDIGLIAQEVEKVIPEVVYDKTLTTGEYADNPKDVKTVDYAKLVALLIESNKELQNRVSDLEEEIKKKK